MAFVRRQRESESPELSPPEPNLALDQAAILAEATSEVRLVAQVARAAASGSWRAACWLLERKYPQRWGTGSREPELGVPRDGDPFAAVDELARRRRLHLSYD
jgi:hypothetical protein